MRLLALPLLLDKTIAHTKGYAKSHYKDCTNRWCGAIVTIFTARKFCENFINEDNFNNTFCYVLLNCLRNVRTTANVVIFSDSTSKNDKYNYWVVIKIKALFILYNMSKSVAWDASHYGVKIQPSEEAFHPFVIFEKSDTTI